MNEIQDNISEQVWDKLCDQVWYQCHDQILVKNVTELRNEIGIDCAFRYHNYNEVLNNIQNQVRDQMLESLVQNVGRGQKL